MIFYVKTFVGCKNLDHIMIKHYKTYQGALFDKYRVLPRWAAIWRWEYPGCDGLPGAINGAQITPRRVVNIFIAGRLFMIMGRNIFFEAMHVRIFECELALIKDNTEILKMQSPFLLFL